MNQVTVDYLTKKRDGAIAELAVYEEQLALATAGWATDETFLNSEIQKEKDARSAEINQLISDKTALQAQVDALQAQVVNPDLP